MKADLEIITGFIGAGKSAFINALIEETFIEHEKILVITLEDGHTAIVNDLNKGYQLIHISYNKSIYELQDVLKVKIEEYKPDRVIIEHNCTERIEDLLFILLSKELYKYVKLNSLYFVTDIKTLKLYILNMEELIGPSLENSNLIVLNNCKNSSDKEIKEAFKLVQARNLNGHIITAEDNRNLKESIRNSKLFTRSAWRKLKISYKRHKGVEIINENI